MINYLTGNILDSTAQAIVNTVNTVGVMGKGIALQFKNQFPNNYKLYKVACEKNELKIGNLLITEEESLLSGKKIIINFPTKTHWRYPSEYEYIEKGLEELKKVILDRNIESVAIPPLGAGNGGLDWQKVKQMIIDSLSEIDCTIYLYEPTAAIKEILIAERVKLTPARAMLLSVLYEMVRNGEFVSEFAAEKTAYFLQRFGAKEEFKLKFEPNFYGPYSGKVRHVLYYLNGSYVMGYSAKDKKPFDDLSLIMDAEHDVVKFLNQPENERYKVISDKTKSFLKGYFSPFGLELLSTIDFIKTEKDKHNTEDILRELENWSDRKRTLFANPVFINKALSNINQQLV
ncbi:macro domain-containing protein [Flavobacterium sp.]|uniref:type II toxin-antitoxin system antitoxin DNA ADP-ribosyl glycohydrolase DarG n=1 Tax=Flavobacterium sp. TaxID=239 RepID=UPI00261FB3D2|nr:macro domain-containing protein [Flavobacterium sp.]